MSISDYDRQHISDILKDYKGESFSWFSAHLIRLIAKADAGNRERLRSAFPEHVQAFEDYYHGTGDTRTVVIPAREEHEGRYRLTVTIPWHCLICGGRRGEPQSMFSYDGSRRLVVDGWTNPCGHVESYTLVRNSLTEVPS